MSCRYFFYCPTCGKSSDEIGTNNPLECGKILSRYYMYIHAVVLLEKVLGECCFHIESCNLSIHAAKEFFKNHEWCLEKNDYLLLNELNEICVPYLVKSDFGFGGTYKKLERSD